MRCSLTWVVAEPVMKKVLLGILLLLGVVVIGAIVFVQNNPGALVQMAADHERGKARLARADIVIDGQNWPYLIGGSGEETILLIHGFGADKDNWTRFSAHFTEQYRVIAPDLPGFGEAERHEGWLYDIDTQVRRIRGFADALGLKRFHILGNSMGGHISAVYTLTYPDQVISLGLFNNAGVQEPNPSPMTLALREGRNLLLVESPEDFDRFMDFLFVTPPPVPDMVKQYFVDLAVNNRDFNDYIFKQLVDRSRGRLNERLSAIQQPVLVLWGRQDQVIDVSVMDAMRPHLSNARYEVFDDVGHLPMIEVPERSATVYREFLVGQ